MGGHSPSLMKVPKGIFVKMKEKFFPNIEAEFSANVREKFSLMSPLKFFSNCG